MESITTALKTSMTSIAGDMTKSVGDILPIALPVMGGIAVIGIGIKIFRKVTGKS